ncbi:hypothetical protein D6829_02760 [Candidatus Pacearchaeota archaeon]|nr:MAG: hypothetical protein D6829_02760 [Candidatus Pacearchaeota archaeon]
MRKIPQDILGNIAILKFPRGMWLLKKKFLAWRFLRHNRNVRTVLEKVEGFSGELRVPKLKHLAGERTNVARYKESGCIFEFNVDKTYFSPRLSNERLEISREILGSKKKSFRVLVMFAGVGPYPIVLAKMAKARKKKLRIFLNELNPDAFLAAKRNAKLNKVLDFIEFVEGDARDLPKKKLGKFDFIVMPRPNIKETFLKTALKLSKKGTKIFYHGFGDKKSVEEEIKREIGGRVKDLNLKTAGDIGYKRFRVRASFVVR